MKQFNWKVVYLFIYQVSTSLFRRQLQITRNINCSFFPPKPSFGTHTVHCFSFHLRVSLSVTFQVALDLLKAAIAFQIEMCQQNNCETNLRFYILSWQGRSNYFDNGYHKIKLFALATTSASLSIYHGKLLKLLLNKNGKRSHTYTYYICCWLFII